MMISHVHVIVNSFLKINRKNLHRCRIDGRKIRKHSEKAGKAVVYPGKMCYNTHRSLASQAFAASAGTPPARSARVLLASRRKNVFASKHFCLRNITHRSLASQAFAASAGTPPARSARVLLASRRKNVFASKHFCLRNITHRIIIFCTKQSSPGNIHGNHRGPGFRQHRPGYRMIRTFYGTLPYLQSICCGYRFFTLRFRIKGGIFIMEESNLPATDTPDITETNKTTEKASPSGTFSVVFPINS